MLKVRLASSTKVSGQRRFINSSFKNNPARVLDERQESLEDLRRQSHGPLGELVRLVQIAPQLPYSRQAPKRLGLVRRLLIARLHGRASALEVTILHEVLNRIGGLSEKAGAQQRRQRRLHGRTYVTSEWGVASFCVKFA